MTYQIIQGDNRDTLKTIESNSIDAIVTDPPYGIDFLGKDWDANVGALETYQECLRVLKPGGHILAFSAARTYHHLAITLEQAGFEIRDQIMWIYSSGFPKSQDIGKSIDRSANKKPKTIKNGTKKSRGERIEGFDLGSGTRCPECKRDSNARYSCTKGDDCGMVYKPQTPEAKKWAGWGTQLKPAHEPICMGRKPLKTSIAANVQKHGTGALNIDACRIESTDLKPGTMGKAPPNLNDIGSKSKIETSEEPWIPNESGRFPSNVLGEIPEYQKFFYCPKVSRAERHIGHELPEPMFGDVQGAYDENGNRMAVGLDQREGNVGNNHPTVKPIELMKYLIKLVTPAGGVVLDPFNGSGSTGMAAVELGMDYIGLELDPKYVDIATRRIDAWAEQVRQRPIFDQLFVEND